MKDILHWIIVHLLADYHFEYKMLYRMMVVIAKYEYSRRILLSILSYRMVRWWWTLRYDVSTSHWNERHLSLNHKRSIVRISKLTYICLYRKKYGWINRMWSRHWLLLMMMIWCWWLVRYSIRCWSWRCWWWCHCRITSWIIRCWT